MVNVALGSSDDGRLVVNATTASGENSSYQRVGFDAFGTTRNERRYNSFNFFARGDATSSQSPSSSNRRWLAVVDGSTRKVLYNKVLPDSFVNLSNADITAIRTAVNMAELPQERENFTSWAEARISNAALRAESADPDFDGLTNLFEYAYGTDPIVADSQKGPRVVVEGGLAKLRFQRSLIAQVTPLSLIGGDSPENSIPFDPGTMIDVGEAEDGIETITVTLPLSLGARYFLRLTTSAL